MLISIQSSYTGIMPQDICFGDVIFNIYIDGTSLLAIVAVVLLGTVSRKVLRKLKSSSRDVTGAAVLTFGIAADVLSRSPIRQPAGIPHSA